MKKTNFMPGLTALIIALMIFPAEEVTARKTNKKKVTNKTVIVKKTPSHYYSHLPKWGHRVKCSPRNSVVIGYGNVNYLYHSGVYYKPHRGSYIISAPPTGLRIRKIPAGHSKILISGRNYYYYYGTYYIYNRHLKAYEVVKAPMGAMVPSIPDGFSTRKIHGRLYYALNDVYYMKILKNGEVCYMVKIC